MIPVRDDLRALEGYHSPQVDVRVRLNTNESPLPPPDAWRDAFAAELSRVEWHRYPDRRATELREAIADLHGVSADMVFAANGSNEVLQTILLTYAGHGRTVATFEPTYQMHAQIARVVGSTVVEGERDTDFSLDRAEMRRVVESAHPDVTFLTSPNNPTGLVEPAEHIEQLLQLDSGLVVADEAYAQFADWSALSMIDEQRPLVVTRTFSKTWSMAGVRLGYVIGPTWFVSELEKVVLPYHLDAAKQIAGRLALRFRRRHGRPGAIDRGRARALVGRDAIDGRSTSLPAARTSFCSDPETFRAVQCGRGCSIEACSCATARGGHGWRTACGSPWAPPTRTTTFWPPSERSSATRRSDREGIIMSRTATRSRVTKETSIEVRHRPRRVGTDRRVDRYPVLRPHARSARAATVGSISWSRPRATFTSTPTTRWRTSRSPSAKRSARRSATRPVFGASPADGSRSTRRWSTSPSTCRVAPTSSGSCRCPRSCRSAIRRSTRSSPSTPSRRSPTSAAMTLHVELMRGRNVHHIIEATFKGLARSLRDAVRVDGRAVSRRPRVCCDPSGRRGDHWSPYSTTESAICTRLEKAIEKMGADARLTTDAGLIADADGVVLPGVGAFGACMNTLRSTGLERPALDAVASGRPFLGICVGMQMLFDASDEDDRRPAWA